MSIAKEIAWGIPLVIGMLLIALAVAWYAAVRRRPDVWIELAQWACAKAVEQDPALSERVLLWHQKELGIVEFLEEDAGE